MRKYISLLLAVCCCILAVRFTAAHGSSFITAPDVAWAQPGDMALNNVGPADPTVIGRPYDCTKLTYRFIDDLSKTMHSGCFEQTAFGMMDPSQAVAIFNNTDEAELIKANGQPAALSPLPASGAVAQFGGFPNVGTYMYLYTNFYSVLGNGGNPLTGRYKTVTQSPNFTLTDSSGLPLAINTSAFSYSARSQWLVTEVPGHALVRINLTTFDIMPFGDPFDLPGHVLGARTAAMAVSEDGRYVAVARNDYKSLRVYDLKNCGSVANSDPLAPQNCHYHDYWPYIEQQASGNISRIGRLHFIQDGLLSFDAQGVTTDSYLLSPDGPITALIPYLGLGDSFASGEGAFDYLSGTDTYKNRCHTSARSYPLLLNQDLFGSRGHSVACSGARSPDVGSTSVSYAGQSSEKITAQQQESSGGEVPILHDFSPGYLAQQRFVTAYQPGIITLQIGGNDVGFSNILLRCLSPLASAKPPRLNPNSCYQSYEDRLELARSISREYANWVQLYQQLQRQSPQSRLYVVGYPQILSAKADCRINVPLTLPEIAFAREVTLYLNSMLQQAATAAGANYIDIADALTGRELCSGASGTLAVNGLTAGNDAYGIGQESFHPNTYGHQLIEQAILQHTHNFAAAAKPLPPAVAAPAPEVVAGEPLLQAPKSGRPITTVVNRDITATSVSHGATVTIKIDGSDAGLQPNSPYVVQIGSITSGTLQSDASGSITGTLPVPPDVPGGIQVITVTGPGQTSTPVTVTQPVDVAVSPDDTDGDGIVNQNDSCPTIVNSGQDSNHNGIDDVCEDVSVVMPMPPANPEPVIIPNANVETTPLVAAAISLQASPVPDTVLRTPAHSTHSGLQAHAATRSGQVLGATVQSHAMVHAHQKFDGLPLFYWYWWLLGILLGYIVIATK